MPKDNEADEHYMCINAEMKNYPNSECDMFYAFTIDTSGLEINMDLKSKFQAQNRSKAMLCYASLN